MRVKERVILYAIIMMLVFYIALSHLPMNRQSSNVVSRDSILNIRIESGLCIHVVAVVKRADGTVETIKDGVALNNDAILTVIGKEFIEGKLGNPSFANNTKFPVYISLSTTLDTPSSSWTSIPGEITGGGLARAQGTYSSTGIGSWKITHTFTATQSFEGIRVVGLHWDSSGNGNLFAVDTISPTNLNVNDQLIMTFYINVS